MLNMFYERKITDEEFEKLDNIKNHNPMAVRRVKVGDTFAPFTVGQIELFHYIQKLEDKYQFCKEDRIANIFEDRGIQFHMNNIDGWHP